MEAEISIEAAFQGKKGTIGIYVSRETKGKHKGQYSSNGVIVYLICINHCHVIVLCPFFFCLPACIRVEDINPV